MQAWRNEYGTTNVLREVEHARARVASLVEHWPDELSKPITSEVERAWHQAEKPVFGWKWMAPINAAVAAAEGIARELEALKLHQVGSDAELCELATRTAHLFTEYPDSHYALLNAIGIAPPQGRGMTAHGVFARLQDVRWWRRRMRAHFGQAVENAMRSRGLVRKGRAPYCSDWALRRRTAQKQRTRTMLQEAIATNEEGAQFSLFELAEKSVSNPAIRRAELMTRIRGFEEIATECGHVALFGTLTAPSCYHAQHHGGGINALYEAKGKPSVRAAQKWLTTMWSRARAKLARLSVEFYGFRIAEPHHDGTPHWHALFFVPAHQVETLRFVMKSIWLSEHADEKGAAKHRCKFIKIDAAKGSAAGYVAKYVAKNIDGFEVGPDYEAGGQSETTAHRVEAWASTHRIRQFQQIGGAPVGVWRETRRVQESVLAGMDGAGNNNEASNGMVLLQAAVLFADAASWAGFSKVAAGLALWKEQTGECNAYGEVRQPCVIGVSAGMHNVRTRLHEWRVQWKGAAHRGIDSGGAACHPHARPPSSASASEARSLGPVSITVRTDGRMLYQHAGRWRIHQAISISDEVLRKKPPPSGVGVTFEGRSFCFVP